MEFYPHKSVYSFRSCPSGAGLVYAAGETVSSLKGISAPAGQLFPRSGRTGDLPHSLQVQMQGHEDRWKEYSVAFPIFTCPISSAAMRITRTNSVGSHLISPLLWGGEPRLDSSWQDVRGQGPLMSPVGFQTHPLQAPP